MDYFIEVLYLKSKKAKKIIDGVIPNNQDFYKLGNLLNKSFNKETYDNITQNTDIFKLTWKTQFKKNKFNNTFYDYIINKDSF